MNFCGGMMIGVAVGTRTATWYHQRRVRWLYGNTSTKQQ